jgi:phosphotriesterase-related protein
VKAEEDDCAEVNTVRGPTSVEDLGMTLTHEHLICDWTARMEEPAEEEARRVYAARVEPSLNWRLTDNPGLCRDNARLEDQTAVAEELRNFAEVGGRTVVDCTTGEVGRDPAALIEISERTGLNIVMGSGWYVHAFHNHDEPEASADGLCEQLLAEFVGGVGDTGVRPGVIGEIGVSPQFTECERTRLRAASRAQRRLGVPMFIHLPGWQRRAFEVLDIVLDQEGVAPDAVVLCHMDPSGADVVYQRAVAARGVWMGFDMIGMTTFYPGEGQSPAPEQTAVALAGLIDDGYAERLLLSHDVSAKAMWSRNGGNGFAYVPRLFLARLERHGIPLAVGTGLLTTNPRQLFVGARVGTVC